jgi:hypothetical protein
MKAMATSCVAILTAVGFVSLLYAHHSNSMFDMSAHVWLTGTVVRYEPVNPHAIIELEVTEDGRTSRWIVEGPNPSRLGRLGVDGDFARVGDVIEVCGFFGKDDVSRDSRVHGHVVIRPDGKRWQWGPYGNLERCVNRDEWDTIAAGTNPLRDNTR